MKRILVAFVLLSSLFAASNAVPEAAGSKNVKVKAFVEFDALKPGMTNRVAVRFQMGAGWHLYWKNPGDAGQAPQVALDLPDGWTSGELRFPAPERLEESGIVSFIYKDELVLLTEIAVPENAPTGRLVRVPLKIRWLECADTCIPAEAEGRVEFQVTAKGLRTNRAGQKLVTSALADAPRAPKGWRLSAKKERGGVRLEAQSAGSLLPEGAVVSFFPLDGDHFSPQIENLEVRADAVSLRVPLAKGSKESPAVLRGVLVSGKGWGGRDAGKALEVEVELGGSSLSLSPTSGQLPLWQVFLYALLGGLILNLMPCVFPVLSIKIMAFARHAQGDPRTLRIQGVLYSVGVVLSFLALAGLLIALQSGGKALGWGFQLQTPGFVAAMAALLFLVGLNLAGLFEIGTSVSGLGGSLMGRSGAGGAFWSGVLAVLVASPCTAPFMAGALGWALAQPPLLALSVFAVLGIGMAVPYLVLSFNQKWLKALPRPGEWMVTLRQALAFPMFATTAWLVWVFVRQTGTDGAGWLLGALVLTGMAAWVFGRWDLPMKGFFTRWAARLAALALLGLAGWMSWQGAESRASASGTAVESQGSWQAWSAEKTTRLRREGKPYLVDYTAAWCLTCQVNKRTSLHVKSVERKLKDKNVAVFVADWTDRNPEISKALSAHGRSGVPVYEFFNGDKNGEVELLPEVLTEGIVLSALDRVK